MVSGPLGGQVDTLILRLMVELQKGDTDKVAELSLAIKRLSSANDTVSKTTDRMAISTNIARINLRDFGSSLLIQSIQLQRYVENLTQGFFEFEKLTQQVTILDEKMKGMRETVAAAANQIAQDFGIIRTEVAQALVNVTALGISFENALEIVDIAARGAAAGIGSLDNAATLLVTTNRQFGLSFEDSVITMAKLVAVANEASFNINDMREALSIAGPQAASLGFSLEETAAAMAIMRDAGLDASEAGTAMRNFLIRIQNPTSEAAEKLEELGIDVVDENGNFLDLITILDNVAMGMEGLSEAERLEAQAVIFDIRGQQLLNIERMRGRGELGAFINELDKYNERSVAQAFLDEKSAEVLGTLGVEYMRVKNRAAELNDSYAKALIPSQIFIIDLQNRMKSGFTGLWPPMQNLIGGVLVLGSTFGMAAGQATLFFVNLLVLQEKLGPKFLKFLKFVGIDIEILGSKFKALAFKWKMAMFNMNLDSMKFKKGLFGLGLAAAGVATALLAMQEQEPGMRAFLSAMTGLELALATAMIIGAVAKTFSAHALIPIAGIGIAAALVTYMLSEMEAAKRKASNVTNMQFGGLIPARPGMGTIARIGEGASPEIVSPVPTMRETFREVIRESGGSITVNPTVQVAPFTSLSRQSTDVLVNSITKETIKALRRRGAITR